MFGRPYRIVDYLLLADLVGEKNTVSGWKFTIVYEQANRLLIANVLRSKNMHMHMHMTSARSARAP